MSLREPCRSQAPPLRCWINTECPHKTYLPSSLCRSGVVVPVPIEAAAIPEETIHKKSWLSAGLPTWRLFPHFELLPQLEWYLRQASTPEEEKTDWDKQGKISPYIAWNLPLALIWREARPFKQKIKRKVKWVFKMKNILTNTIHHPCPWYEEKQDWRGAWSRPTPSPLSRPTPSPSWPVGRVLLLSCPASWKAHPDCPDPPFSAIFTLLLSFQYVAHFISYLQLKCFSL